jgi:hypothetical protein
MAEEPKTRKQSKKDQNAKVTVNGKYSSKHARIATEKERNGAKTRKHVNKSARVGKINQEILDN